ncbi:tRNA1(Val) (adenine(37)-N6)-methyltransferase [Roseovarius rhodophyticola]|uniref:Methyltransferase n=1 Tax=Roseovarius rhodophyticola TaxID=3080827 RepID=A0ABZ2TE96_9RHOB|nr:methyltransferase [Roseovarius sp. W115]MDV2930455.1 methyltransferase [Roseovarius sp. W115]
MTQSESDADLSRDAFLGGGLQILQPHQGYRAGIDPVLLAASVPAQPGDSILDLGCGAGVAGLCLARRVPGIALTGLELQAQYAELATQNAAENGIDMTVILGDIAAPPTEIKDKQFSHVIANPPYFDQARRTAADDIGREVALAGSAPLSDWVATAAKRTCPKGTVTFINRTERLPDLLSAFRTHLGSLEALPLAPRSGRAAKLILLRGRKNGNAEFRLHQPWILHEGDKHLADAENYTQATVCILRDAGALNFPA